MSQALELLELNMLTRHANELMTRLEKAEDVGCSEIRNDELLRWYERERLTKSVWRDLHEKWEEVCKDSILLVGEGEGSWLFVYGKGLKTSPDSWLKDVRERAGYPLDS